MEKVDDLKEIKLFIDSCDEMLESKFILVDKRIGDVLKSIAKTKQVYNLMATCLSGFNFDKEWKMATTQGKELVLPMEEKKAIAFVFCLLNAIDDKKININEVLQKYFSCDDCISSYKLFCQKVILPFKVLVVGQLYEKQEKVVVENIIIDTEREEELMKRLVFLIKDFKSYIAGLKRIKKSSISKDDIMQVLNHIIELCETRNVISLPALMVGVRACVCADKELVRRLVEIDSIVKELN